MKTGSSRVGVRSSIIHDAARTDWDGAGPRPIAWTAWYPASDDAAEHPMRGGGTGESLFDIGPAARDAALGAAGQPYPVVVV